MAISKIRKLTASEVSFEVTIEQDAIDFRGNCMASGDDDFDAECEREIAERLDRGDVYAWCSIGVMAVWTAPDGTEYTGYDHLGGCSYEDRAGIDSCIKEHGMRDEALNALNTRLEGAIRSGELLKKALKARR